MSHHMEVSKDVLISRFSTLTGQCYETIMSQYLGYITIAWNGVLRVSAFIVLYTLLVLYIISFILPRTHLCLNANNSTPGSTSKQSSQMILCSKCMAVTVETKQNKQHLGHIVLYIQFFIYDESSSFSLGHEENWQHSLNLAPFTKTSKKHCYSGAQCN